MRMRTVFIVFSVAALFAVVAPAGESAGAPSLWVFGGLNV